VYKTRLQNNLWAETALARTSRGHQNQYGGQAMTAELRINDCMTDMEVMQKERTGSCGSFVKHTYRHGCGEEISK